MTNQPTTVTLRIVLEKPPAGVDYALQEGKGRPFDVVQKQRSKGGDLEFEAADEDDLDDIAILQAEHEVVGTTRPSEAARL